ncbi:hypothetical protein SAMN05421878_11060 [Actinobaculum suis]|uniref:Uncharacterized protein n=1 Tax=Actinobaculum suis TaxID=1657 RepID=A0A0K9ETY5_9ACTO|nr:hypothetical protein [Actinobaculum suis]KMY23598.1 hypothetical protein ACU19_03370 [Actinobaculum suis]MDY5153348.1 hypothetical protein [Actinobaculum suis]OCA96087.1 hypothetical protein ACU20_02960 [Actinobaculum suis]OCA96238.1 hypothetical protein ACU21_02115 [Actinobaculum suis]SDE48623.1 hypothetical protein SAMN05421878_11060 [Actinobaculum suis]
MKNTANTPTLHTGFLTGPGAAPGNRHETEAGDVPGWVMVTLMTVALVIAIWAVAGPALVDIVKSALSRLTNTIN